LKSLLLALTVLGSISSFANNYDNYTPLTARATESLMDTYNYPQELTDKCNELSGVIISRSNDGLSAGAVYYTGSPQDQGLVVAVAETLKTGHLNGAGVAVKCGHLGGRLISEVTGKSIVSILPESIEGVLSRTDTTSTGARLID
jgi:hypothetical protein